MRAEAKDSPKAVGGLAPAALAISECLLEHRLKCG